MRSAVCCCDAPVATVACEAENKLRVTCQAKLTIRFYIDISLLLQQKQVMDTLPLGLKEELACAVNNRLFSQVLLSWGFALEILCAGLPMHSVRSFIMRSYLCRFISSTTYPTWVEGKKNSHPRFSFFPKLSCILRSCYYFRVVAPRMGDLVLLPTVDRVPVH